MEVRRYLEGKRVEPETIDETVRTLLDQGHLDDARYARRFVEDRRHLDHWGAGRIERKLIAVGIEPDLIEGALAGDETATELEAAVALLRRRFREPLDEDRLRARALGVLLRKGYELELAHDAIRAHGR